MVRVTRNTYPEVEGVAHAERGDVCEWEMRANGYALVRQSDGKILFMTIPVRKDGTLINGKRPVLEGVIGCVKKNNWVLEVERI